MSVVPALMAIGQLVTAQIAVAPERCAAASTAAQIPANGLAGDPARKPVTLMLASGVVVGGQTVFVIATICGLGDVMSPSSITVDVHVVTGSGSFTVRVGWVRVARRGG